LTKNSNTTCVFGGFSIIFSGNFCQLEPVCSNDSELLFSSLSSGLWDNSINVVIILDNDHCFKEDPEYGKMLKRMWNGDLTNEDQKQINTRVIGYQGLKLPTTFEGKQSHMNQLETYLNFKSFYLELEYFTLLCIHSRCLLCLSNKQGM
jgi:hypothetical protein